MEEGAVDREEAVTGGEEARMMYVNIEFIISDRQLALLDPCQCLSSAHCFLHVLAAAFSPRQAQCTQLLATRFETANGCCQTNPGGNRLHLPNCFLGPTNPAGPMVGPALVRIHKYLTR